jgi:hypothetical protein
MIAEKRKLFFSFLIACVGLNACITYAQQTARKDEDFTSLISTPDQDRVAIEHHTSASLMPWLHTVLCDLA